MATFWKNWWSLSHLWSHVSWLLAVSGALLQIYYISYHYFQYETVTQVTVNRNSIIKIPKVILCAEKTYLANYWGRSNESNILDSILDTNKLISGAVVQESVNFNRTGIYEEELFTVEKLTKQLWLCFSIAVRDELQFLSHRITTARFSPNVYHLYLNGQSRILSDTFDWYLFTISSNLHFYGESLNPILMPQFFTPTYLRNLNSSVSYNNYNQISLSYSYFYTKRLTYPLKTDCFDYSIWNFESQNHCYDYCISQRSIEMFNTIPYEALADNSTHHVRRSAWDIDNSTTVKGCKAKCSRPDCETVEYVPWLNYNKVYEWPRLIMTSPRSPDVITIFKPRFNPIDYVTYILSVISFWFGFSPLVILTKDNVVNWINAKLRLVKRDVNTAVKRNCTRDDCQRAMEEVKLQFKRDLAELRNECLTLICREP